MSPVERMRAMLRPGERMGVCAGCRHPMIVTQHTPVGAEMCTTCRRVRQGSDTDKKGT